MYSGRARGERKKGYATDHAHVVLAEQKAWFGNHIFKATSFFSSSVSRKIRFMQSRSAQQRANHPETGKSLSIKSSGAKIFFFFKKKTCKLKCQVLYYTVKTKKVKEFDTLAKSYPKLIQ